MKKRQFFKVFSVCLVLCMLFSAISFSVSAEESTGELLTCDEVIELDDGGKIYVYNIDGVINEFPVPPEGFNPLTATDKQLETYGFPPRPTDEKSLLDWNEMMSNYKCTPVPQLEKTGNSHLPAQKADVPSTLSLSSTTYYTNWSGYVAKGNFAQVQGDFVQPTIASSNPSYTHESTWVGLGGYNSGKLVQTGTAMNTYAGNKEYYAWYEYLSPAHPNPEIRLKNVTVRAGDKIHAYCSFQKSNNKFNAYIANNTNGTSQSILISISASEFFDQTTAEFINEHPSWGATDNGLTNYGTTKWTNCKVYTMSNSWVNLGSTTYDRAIMVGKNNRTMAQPSGLSGTSFTSTWYNYN